MTDNKRNNIVIKAEGLDIGYKSRKNCTTVHSKMNFNLMSRQLTCLLGPNGTGKSTLLRTLSASQPALRGNLELMGKPLAEYSEKELSRNVGLVLTEKTNAGGLTVRQLVGLGRQPHTGFFGRLSRHDKEVIDHALEATGIYHKAENYTSQLSDGERQKAMIAKALVQECPLILLDEPTAFLDAVSRMEIMTLLHRLAHEENKAILMSTHDIEQALVTADCIWLLTRHEGLAYGTTEDIILSGKMDSLFPDSDIRFDLLHGGFSPTVKGKRSIILYTYDQILRHWTQNALNRYGFLCMDSGSVNDKSKLPALYVYSPNRIILKYKDKEYSADSFSQLISIIENIWNI